MRTTKKALAHCTGVAVLGGGALIGGVGVFGSTAAHADAGCQAYGATSAVAAKEVQAACAEVDKGTPYSWSGGHKAAPGPSTGQIYDVPPEYYDDRNKVGLDCSGLVRWAYYEASGTDFGPVSTYDFDSALTSHGFSRVDAPTQPGDVIVWDGHTAIYLGNGLMAQAEGDDAGLNVRTVASHGGTPTGVYRPGGGTTTPPPPSGGSKVFKDVWATAPSVNNPTNGAVVGTLNKGSNYFYCQTQGSETSYAGYHNDWWLKTDDDSGNANVWVNATYVSGGVDDGQIPGVPTC
ncbi:MULTISPECIES: NlpC/P60 family protein [Allobranchiibius]|uniref:Cell wall-associated NlpC family hydrolase n=1 Tax=Allobranchiibius huperziae TaxID=1874116 RepID=A0A853DDN3_9MICO|nr:MULTISPECIES: NlpC/P60 family protein [Allobranchiibius]MBO1768561.1 C40 family peptidase [Allobranchiibius sp. GilTou38]NYJ74103.1 cell wall-associated NlpC family hydrolase [Allobranchiibius huperziae]